MTDGLIIVGSIVVIAFALRLGIRNDRLGRQLTAPRSLRARQRRSMWTTGAGGAESGGSFDGGGHGGHGHGCGGGGSCSGGGCGGGGCGGGS